MATLFKTFVKLLSPFLFLPTLFYGQEVQTLELSTGVVHPIAARLGNASIIQVPMEPVATNVGDPQMWLVERAERLVSIKPVQAGARDTNLAVITRQGTLNFSVHLASDTAPFTQMVRITRIADDSKPLPSPASNKWEAPAEIIIREIRIAQNYHALKQVNSPELRDVEQVTQMFESKMLRHSCVLLQSFRFRETRHLVLHFVTENKSTAPLTFDTRQTTAGAGETFFAPLAVSLGNNPIAPNGRSENFLVLDASNGFSPRQKFNIQLVEISTPPAP